MLDFTHLTGNSKVRQDIIVANSPITASNWTEWVKPRRINFIHIFMLGGGGGGGGGAVGALASAGGGGGGSSSNQYNFLFPAALLPDILYFSIGVGGAFASGFGAPIAQAGVAGVTSYCGIYPSATPNFLLGLCVGGTGGNPSTSSIAGTAGAANAADTITSACLAALGWNFNTTTPGNITLPNQVGTSGGAAGFNSGVNLTLPTTGLVVTGGAGGAGAPSLSTNLGPSGGGITGDGVFFPSIGGGSGGTVNTGAGGPGYNGSSGTQFIPNLNFFYGGTGGGGCSTGTATTSVAGGGTGGIGGYGCGGGGGGGGFTGSATGRGGRGGDGIAIITCF